MSAAEFVKIVGRPCPRRAAALIAGSCSAVSTDLPQASVLLSVGALGLGVAGPVAVLVGCRMAGQWGKGGDSMRKGWPATGACRPYPGAVPLSLACRASAVVLQGQNYCAVF